MHPILIKKMGEERGKVIFQDLTLLDFFIIDSHPKGRPRKMEN